MNSFIYTESTIIPIQAMLPEDFPFSLSIVMSARNCNIKINRILIPLILFNAKHVTYLKISNTM